MPSRRLALLLFVAMLPCWGCGRSCGRDRATKTEDSPPATAVAPPVTAPPPAPSTATVATTTLAPAPADGRYTLYRPSRWTVGEVATSDSTTSTTGRITKISPDGGSSELPTVRETVRATWLERATEVDADGRRTQYLVHLRNWTRTGGRDRDGRNRDRSVQGAYLTVNGSGPTRSWSFVGRAPQPTDEARNWLDEHFGSRGLSDAQWLRMMLPDERVAVGDSWSPDTVLFAQEAAGSGMKIDQSNAKATVTLQAIAGGSAQCRFQGTFALLQVPNTDLGWSKGGTMTFEGEMDVSLEPAPLRLATLHRKAALQGETTEDGTTMQYDFVSDERRKATAGGDFVEPSP